MKKIALVINAANFEKHREVVDGVKKAVKEVADAALCVITTYGNKPEAQIIDGENVIYTLLEKYVFDGYIIDSSANVLADHYVARTIEEKNKPMVFLDSEYKDYPYVGTNGYKGTYELVSYLIEEKGCKKINFAADLEYLQGLEIGREKLRAYRDAIVNHGLEYDSDRMFQTKVTLENGRNLYERFRGRGKEDCDAVVCNHDVLAIGFCFKCLDEGIDIPGDIKIASLRRSGNSIALKPGITGLSSEYETATRMAVEVLWKEMANDPVERVNIYDTIPEYDQSTGDEPSYDERASKLCSNIIYNKIEAGSQIKNMMSFYEAVENANSMAEYASKLDKMMHGVGIKRYILCINRDDIHAIENAKALNDAGHERAYAETMTAVVGCTDEVGYINMIDFPTNELVPTDARCGDCMLLLPIFRKGRAYGYMAFINEFVPTGVQNYRICHESIAPGLEGLKKVMEKVN